MKLLAVIAALALTGCGTTVYEVSAGANVSKYSPWGDGTSGGFAGPQEVVSFAVRNEQRNGVFVEWRHTSHASAGWPVNSEREDWMDLVSVGYRFKTEH